MNGQLIAGARRGDSMPRYGESDGAGGGTGDGETRGGRGYNDEALNNSGDR